MHACVFVRTVLLVVVGGDARHRAVVDGPAPTPPNDDNTTKQSDEDGAFDRPVRALSDFRRGRGDAKRVVVVAGSAEVVQATLDAARPLRDRLVASSFLIVPVVLTAPGDGAVLGLAQEKLTGWRGEPYVGWPLLLAGWAEYLAAEAAAARKQGVDPEKQVRVVVGRVFFFWMGGHVYVCVCV